jgi:predicted metal-dependent hydrolase
MVKISLEKKRGEEGHLPDEAAVPCLHSRRPRNLHIMVRRIVYDYRASLKTNPYWFNHNPFMTHFVNALQSLFPEGERSFIEAAMDGAKILRQRGCLNAQMEQDLKLFQQQEALHGQQHRLWNQALIEAGYKKLAQYDEKFHRSFVRSRKRVSAKWRLAFTAAAEHFTASLAYIFVYINQDLLTKSAFPFNSLLLYHAMEEVEHKSVCFDLSKMLSPSYLRRVISLVFVSLNLAINIYTRMRYMLKKDGLWGRAYRANIWGSLLGKRGLLRGLFPRIALYLRPSFHPWLTDEREDIERIFGSLITKNGIPPFKYE